MKARLLKIRKLQDLLGGIQDNLDRYRTGDFEFLKINPSNYIETNHEIDEVRLSSANCTKENNREMENCVSLFEAMGKLSHYLARDERLWVYLTHTDLLQYARSRWPIPDDDEKAVKHIRTHFHVVGARGFERDNAASRLWWMASLCSRVGSLSLNDALTTFLYQSDVRANIIERPTTSQSVHVFSTVINKLHESFNGDKRLFVRETFRAIMKELNLQGGIKLLGAMAERDVQKIFEYCLRPYA